jgi:uncharacterized protein
MEGLQVIKIDELKKQPKIPKEYSFKVDPTIIFQLTGHIKPSSPILLEFSIYFDDGIYFMEGHLKGKLKLECNRCTEEVSWEIDYPISERYSTQPKTDEDIIPLDKDELDVGEILKESLEFSLPRKVLCKESCLGLCPQCGCNLNISTCQCHKEQIDPRLAILKDLFKE